MTTEVSALKFTRADYMTKKCDHATYYRQFVNNAVIRLVVDGIGRDKILASKDEHFNDIPLAKWDRLAGVFSRGAVIIGRPSIPTERLIREAEGQMSLSDCVCTFKQVAHMIREGLL